MRTNLDIGAADDRPQTGVRRVGGMRVARNQWYPLLESRELGRKPLRLERLGQHFVFWRTADFQPHAHLDRCPHLGAALSRGAIGHDRLVCPFHGFEFDRQGRCQHIPALGRSGTIPKRMTLSSFRITEAYGFIWLWWGECRQDYPELSYFSELKNGWRFGTIRTEWPTHYRLCIENQLDVAHLPFVHRTTIGAGNRTIVEGPYVEADIRGIKVWLSNQREGSGTLRSIAELGEAASKADPTISFLFPGIWMLNIGTRVKNFIAFVPINETTTRLYVRIYHKVTPWPLDKLFEMALGIANRFILGQDRRVVLTQRPNADSDTANDVLIGADRAIIQFRRLYAQLCLTEQDGR